MRARPAGDNTMPCSTSRRCSCSLHAFRENRQVDLETLRAACMPCVTTWRSATTAWNCRADCGWPCRCDNRYVARLGGYDVEGPPGRGGMGFVLKGFDPGLARYVALKLIIPSLVDDPVVRGRFIREARTAARLKHQNIVTIYSVALDHVPPFLVMEYVSGLSLAALLETESPLAAERAVRWMLQLLAALAHAHAEGFIHRDVKPGNVLLDRHNDRIKLADFGLRGGLSRKATTRRRGP